MSRLRDRRGPAAIAAAVALAGAAATVVLATATGMPGDELGGLALSLLPALAVSVVAAVAATRALGRSSIRRRTVGVVLVASGVGLANLIVLGAVMYLDGSDVGHLAVLLLYSTAAGAGAALALTSGMTMAVDRLNETARKLGSGDLEARTGPIDAGPELAELSRTLDDMAVRLGASIERERELEAERLDMITAASHDLRTPLASLRAMLEAIEDGMIGDGPERDRYMAEMRSSVDSLVGLTDDLFELVQLEAGALEAESDRARLADVTAAALALCEATALDQGIQIRAQLAEAERAPCSPRLARVIQNLVQNAIRHTPAGGSVTISGELTASGIEIVVVDDGEGIAPEVIDKVFEPFWRGDSARTSTGSGLGLTLVKRIVEGLGGEVQVSSHPSGGARFAVLVPES